MWTSSAVMPSGRSVARLLEAFGQSAQTSILFCVSGDVVASTKAIYRKRASQSPTGFQSPAHWRYCSLVSKILTPHGLRSFRSTVSVTLMALSSSPSIKPWKLSNNERNLQSLLGIWGRAMDGKSSSCERSCSLAQLEIPIHLYTFSRCIIVL